MYKFSVFANFLINDEIRFKIMKDSFNSFCDSNISDWVINIRGNYKYHASNFLKKNIKKGLKIFFLDSPQGWNYDTSQIIKFTKSEYIFFWIEDHLCISGNNLLNKTIRSIYINKIDYMCYSWFFFGNNIKSLNFIHLNEDNNIYYLNYSKNLHLNREKFSLLNDIIYENFIISMCSIMKRKLFISILFSRDKFFYKWSKKLPFNFEKTNIDTHWLPYKLALSKNELFASIDDDLGYAGYSLISRNLYQCDSLKVRNVKSKRNILLNNKIFSKPKNFLYFFIKKIFNELFILIFLIKKKYYRFYDKFI